MSSPIPTHYHLLIKQLFLFFITDKEHSSFFTLLKDQKGSVHFLHFCSCAITHILQHTFSISAPTHSLSCNYCPSHSKLSAANNQKHCQRHNGSEGWVLLTRVISLGHIKVLTQILIKFHLQNLDQASTSKSQPNISISIWFKFQNLD